MESSSSIQEEGEKLTPCTPQDRIARYDKFFDLRTLNYRYRKTNKSSEDKRYRQLTQKRVVLLSLRHFDHKGNFTYKDVEIRSLPLRGILLKIHENDDTHNLKSIPATCNDNLLYHSYHTLQDMFKSETNKEIRADIEVALTYIQEECGQALQETRVLFNANIPSVSFQLLWTLFPFGELVYHYYDETEQDMILKARSFKIDRDPQTGEVFGYVTCTIISNDGRLFGLSPVVLKIPKYDGNQAIENLKAFPLRFHRKEKQIYLSCVERGKKYADLGEQNYVEITDGQAIRMERTVSGDVIKKFFVNGRVMIDPKSFHMFEPNSKIPHHVQNVISGENGLTDDEYAICDPVVLGFSFGSKSWGGFPLDKVKEFEWSEEAFNCLVVDQRVKRTIKTLVSQRASGKSSFDDIVKDKGKGLVGLLAGGPGCGKTLTAEGIAEISKCPLYNVSAGELGTVPADVDRNLQKILSLGHRWNAVVLLDEADVFMSKRSVVDINRNALVSIFLRQLEYYQGILILTTNRAQDCDSAFESRMHFTIPYPDLTPTSRRVIWKNFINKTNMKNNISDKNLDDLMKWQLNGRQIKNIVSVANICCLENPEQVLTYEVIENSMKTTSNWTTELGQRSRVDVPTTICNGSSFRLCLIATIAICIFAYAYMLVSGIHQSFHPIVLPVIRR